jgi:hypothetical protein
MEAEIAVVPTTLRASVRAAAYSRKVVINKAGKIRYTADGKPVKKTVQMGPGRLPDGSPQPFYNENGVFKGVYVEVDPDRRMLDPLSSTAETWPRLNEAVPRSGRFDTSYIVIDMSQTIVHGDKQRA